MDYEKKYKEALANARQEYNTTENVERKQWLEELFPELADSEDEKIRKELIFYLGDMPEDTELRNGVTNRDVLVWLEKQSEKEPLPIDIDAMVSKYANNDKRENEGFGKPINCMIRAYRQGIEDTLNIVKQEPVEMDKLVKGAYKTLALSFISYLDAHSYEGKMCVSNAECEDIEDAFANADWGKIGRYYNKFTQKPTDSCEEAKYQSPDRAGDNITLEDLKQSGVLLHCLY